MENIADRIDAMPVVPVIKTKRPRLLSYSQLNVDGNPQGENEKCGFLELTNLHTNKIHEIEIDKIVNPLTRDSVLVYGIRQMITDYRNTSTPAEKDEAIESLIAELYNVDGMSKAVRANTGIRVSKDAILSCIPAGVAPEVMAQILENMKKLKLK